MIVTQSMVADIATTLVFFDFFNYDITMQCPIYFLIFWQYDFLLKEIEINENSKYIASITDSQFILDRLCCLLVLLLS